VYDPAHSAHFALGGRADNATVTAAVPTANASSANASAKASSANASTANASSTNASAPPSPPYAHPVARLVTHCALPSVHPGRAYVAMAVPLSSDYSTVRGHQKALLAAALLQQVLEDVLRREHGYVAAIRARPFASTMFRRYGFYQIDWVVGAREGREQIIESLLAVEAVLASPGNLTRATFDRVKAASHARLEAQLQHSASWLPALRGLALRPPAWTRHPLFSTVADLAQTDVLGGIERLSFEEVVAFFARTLARTRPTHVAIVETVAADADEAAAALPRCVWQGGRASAAAAAAAVAPAAAATDVKAAPPPAPAPAPAPTPSPVAPPRM
jgi:hypothetical protein